MPGEKTDAGKSKTGFDKFVEAVEEQEANGTEAGRELLRQVEEAKAAADKKKAEKEKSGQQ